MNKYFGFVWVNIWMMFNACSFVAGSDSSSEPVKGKITGGTVVTNSISKPDAGVLADNRIPDEIYLFRSDEPEVLLKTVRVSADGTFVFDSLELDSYDIYSNDNAFGALQKNIVLTKEESHRHIERFEFFPVKALTIEPKLPGYESLQNYHLELIQSSDSSYIYPYIMYNEEYNDSNYQQTVLVIYNDGGYDEFDLDYPESGVKVIGDNTSDSLLSSSGEEVVGFDSITQVEVLPYKIPCEETYMESTACFYVLDSTGNDVLFEYIEGLEFVWGHKYEVSLGVNVTEEPAVGDPRVTYEVLSVISDVEDSVGTIYYLIKPESVNVLIYKDNDRYLFEDKEVQCPNTTSCDEGLFYLNDSDGEMTFEFEYLGGGEVQWINWET